jgi:pyroglutamyl-peptidase
MSGARLLVTGFGPFPGAPENPTERLIRALEAMPASAFGAAEFRAALLPTEYRRSAEILDRLRGEFIPDIIVHFGLNDRSDRLHIECTARNTVDPAKPDAADDAPAVAVLAADGPATLPATFPAAAILAALTDAGFPAALSDDAGAYVCNATLYRSLAAAPHAARIGFIHVPPEGQGGYNAARLVEAATIALRTTCAAAIGIGEQA